MATKTSGVFIYLAFATVLLTLGLIVFGAVVRVTDSGLGCGNDWPLCDGKIIPPLDNLTAWIEWSHRLFATLIGFFGIAMLYTAWRSYRTQRRSVLNITLMAAALFLLQSLLGAMVVVWDLPPTMVTLHLGTAMLLLGSLLAAGLVAWHKPQHHHERDNFTLLAYITAALSLVIILTGALVRGSGATLACTDWPLCNGAIFPVDQGQLQLVHMVHRYAVVGLGITLLMLSWYAMKTRSDSLTRTVAVGAFAVYLMQALVGAFFVASSAAPLWGAAHVGLAAGTWGLLIGLSVIDTLNSMTNPVAQEATEWNPQSVTN